MAATALELTEYRRSQRDLVRLATRDLRAFLRTLDLSDAVAASRALQEFMPNLVQVYGEVGAALAADFYESLRERERTRALYQVIMADAVPITQAQASTRWAAAPLFTDTPDESSLTGRLLKITDRLVKLPGRETMRVNATSDPAKPRYARVPSGPDTCPFCTMLASRGAVYLSEATATGFHDDCDCVPTPVFGEQLPEGYDPQAYYEKYKAARAESTGHLNGPDGILNAMRRNS